MSSVKSRRAEYSESTRDAVLDSAAELFVRQGYPRTSLDEIAAAARVTKGAIYHHFESKAALMTALVERMEGATSRSQQAVFAAEVDRLGAVAAGQTMLDGFLENCSDPVYGRLVFREAPLALGWEEWERCMRPFAVSSIEETFRRAVSEGAMPGPVSDTTVRLFFGVLRTIGQLLGETSQEDLPHVREEARVVLAAVTGALFSGPAE